MNDLFVQFYMLQIDISRAADGEDELQTSRLESRMSILWAEILAADPESPEDTKVLVAFLLDQLAEAGNSAEIKAQIRKKVMGMFWQQQKWPEEYLLSASV